MGGGGGVGGERGKTSELESEEILVTRPDDNHSPGPVTTEVSP